MSCLHSKKNIQFPNFIITYLIQIVKPQRALFAQQKSENESAHRKFGISLHAPDNWERQLAAGGAFGLKSEPHHRGMKLGISLHVPDNWGRQLAAESNWLKGYKILMGAF